MKIIFATESFSPNISGVATATINLANNMAKAGHQVFVLTPGKTFKTHIDKSFSDFTVYRLRSIANPFRAGFHITFSSKSEIKELVSKIDPDIIHIQDPAAIGTRLRDVGNELGIPVIITNHFSLEYALSYVRFLGLFMPAAKESLVKYLVNFYNKCDLVLTPTETFVRQIKSWGVKTPVIAASNGVDFERFQKNFAEDDFEKFRIKYQLPDNPAVLYLGRVDKDKSVDILIRAIPLVLKEINAHFIIAGSGDEIGDVKKLVDELGLRNNVTFLGQIDHNSDDFIMVYKGSSLFAIPSKIETQSIVTLEALSAGLPVVAARAGALPELVKDGENGYVFSPDNVKELASKIIELLSDKNLTEKMKKEAVKSASVHKMSNCFNHMLEIYKQVLRSKSNNQNQV